jgi:hypothetical protein
MSRSLSEVVEAKLWEAPLDSSKERTTVIPWGMCSIRSSRVILSGNACQWPQWLSRCRSLLLPIYTQSPKSNYNNRPLVPSSFYFNFYLFIILLWFPTRSDYYELWCLRGSPCPPQSFSYKLFSCTCCFVYGLPSYHSNGNIWTKEEEGRLITTTTPITMCSSEWVPTSRDASDAGSVTIPISIPLPLASAFEFLPTRPYRFVGTYRWYSRRRIRHRRWQYKLYMRINLRRPHATTVEGGVMWLVLIS